MNSLPNVQRTECRLSKWVALVEMAVVSPGRPTPEIYHAFSQADYVSVLAMSRDGRFPLVSQYRPACGEVTLELPGGMLDVGEEPALCARRELLEETGCGAGQLTPLGVLWPDPGRLTNRLHCFFARDVLLAEDGWQPEVGLEPRFVDVTELRRVLATGQLSNAHHVAIIGLALAAGFLSI
ncbi:MAG: NUDIX hydrolase [Sulfuritalea sp.]|nr:NUDIX hydrolase [Sulfuritalea sp.]